MRTLPVIGSVFTSPASQWLSPGWLRSLGIPSRAILGHQDV
ncbi:MAG: hypothetical protein ABIQ95_00430 [Bdellovibrionia bacterium]